METSKFYEEFDKLRLRDMSSRTGYESDRQMAKRLGIHNKTITLYKRGAVPHPQTVQMIIKAGGYNTETFQRLMSAAANREGMRMANERQVPVYRKKDIGLDAQKGGPVFFLTVPVELNSRFQKGNLVGVLLEDSDSSCEPRISRGDVAIYLDEPCEEPEDGKFYVFADARGAQPALMRVRGREFWRSRENLEDLVKITRERFRRTTLGKVVMKQGFMINGIFDE